MLLHMHGRGVGGGVNINGHIALRFSVFRERHTKCRGKKGGAARLPPPRTDDCAARRAKSLSLEWTRLTFGRPPFNLSFPSIQGSSCKSQFSCARVLAELQGVLLCRPQLRKPREKGPLRSPNSHRSLHACTPRTPPPSPRQ